MSKKRNVIPPAVQAAAIHCLRASRRSKATRNSRSTTGCSTPRSLAKESSVATEQPPRSFVTKSAGGFQRAALRTQSPPSWNCAASLRHADEHSGRHFPDRGLFIRWLAGTANGSGAEPCLFSPEGEQIFNPNAC